MVDRCCCYPNNPLTFSVAFLSVFLSVILSLSLVFSTQILYTKIHMYKHMLGPDVPTRIPWGIWDFWDSFPAMNLVTPLPAEEKNIKHINKF